ncbi:MAG: hypothetical protein M1299_03805, partial [Firmicutes bacterium]|nr:hypothetical protein [Bacillota bacterium]
MACRSAVPTVAGRPESATRPIADAFPTGRRAGGKRPAVLCFPACVSGVPGVPDLTHRQACSAAPWPLKALLAAHRYPGGPQRDQKCFTKRGNAPGSPSGLS